MGCLELQVTWAPGRSRGHVSGRGHMGPCWSVRGEELQGWDGTPGSGERSQIFAWRREVIGRVGRCRQTGRTPGPESGPWQAGKTPGRETGWSRISWQNWVLSDHPWWWNSPRVETSSLISPFTSDCALVGWVLTPCPHCALSTHGILATPGSVPWMDGQHLGSFSHFPGLGPRSFWIQLTGNIVIYVCVCSVMSDSLQPHRLQPSRLLCPWDFPGRNTGVGYHFLLQGLFPTPRSNPCLLCLLPWKVDSLPLTPE